MHIYSDAPYLPLMKSIHDQKYRRVIGRLREHGEDNLILAMEGRALLISQILRLDPLADFFVVCMGEENQWEIVLKKISQKAQNILPHFENAFSGFVLQISFPKSGK